MARKRRQFTREFKLEAVGMITSGERKVEELARDPGGARRPPARVAEAGGRVGLADEGCLGTALQPFSSPLPRAPHYRGAPPRRCGGSQIRTARTRPIPGTSREVAACKSANTLAAHGNAARDAPASCERTREVPALLAESPSACRAASAPRTASESCSGVVVAGSSTTSLSSPLGSGRTTRVSQSAGDRRIPARLRASSRPGQI